MKIAYLCSEYPAISHTFILREVEALRRRGSEIDLLDPPHQRRPTCSRAPTAPPSRAPSPCSRRAGRDYFGAHLGWRCPSRDLSLGPFGALRLAPAGPRGLLWQFFYFVEAVLLWDECRRRGIRHVHVHFANVSAASPCSLPDRLRARPGAPGPGASPCTAPPSSSTSATFASPRSCGAARFVVCISDFARSQLMSLSEPERLAEAPGVHWASDRAVHATRRRLLAEPAPEVLCIGRLVPVKGQAVLIEAVSPAGRARPGGGADVGRGRAAAPGAGRSGRAPRGGGEVSFRGAVGQDEIRSLYEAAVVFCLPSFSEGVPSS